MSALRPSPWRTGCPGPADCQPVADEGSFQRDCSAACALPEPAGLPRLCRETLGPGAEDRPAGSGDHRHLPGSAATTYRPGCHGQPVHHGQHEQLPWERRSPGWRNLPPAANCRWCIFCASGGARMQEGIYSLMQMAKTSAAIGRLGEAGCLYISVLTNPTTGGVTASALPRWEILSWQSPRRLIGFAGPRVIEQTIKQKLPEGFPAGGICAGMRLCG